MKINIVRMFGLNKSEQKMAKSNEIESTSINLIGSGTIIKGDIICNGDIRIDGTLVGTIKTKGKLVVGESGNIDGDIICQNADFSGTIKGKISVNELLSLKATAKISGDIVTNKLAVEPGATFSGTCDMNSGIKKDDVKPLLKDEKR